MCYWIWDHRFKKSPWKFNFMTPLPSLSAFIPPLPSCLVLLWKSNVYVFNKHDVIYCIHSIQTFIFIGYIKLRRIGFLAGRVRPDITSRDIWFRTIYSRSPLGTLIFWPSFSQTERRLKFTAPLRICVTFCSIKIQFLCWKWFQWFERHVKEV